MNLADCAGLHFELSLLNLANFWYACMISLSHHSEETVSAAGGLEERERERNVEKKYCTIRKH